ncbi:hypothetical protein J7E49_26090 [Variovorax paradoxus]|nr:hypothetical protein [Variovorax paradoxus]
MTGIAAFLKSAGVNDDATARRIAREFADEKGNVQFFNNPGQKKYGGDTLSFALLKAAEKITFGQDGPAAGVPTTIPRPESSRTVRLELNLNGRDLGTVNTDPAGAGAIEGLFTELRAARGSASRG